MTRAITSKEPPAANGTTKLAPIFGTPLSGGILDKAGQVAKEVFGSIDTAQIQLQIEQDKNKLEEFRIGMEAATKDEQAYFADVQSARSQTTSLAQVNSPIAYGAPIMSAVVTIGFIVILTLFVTYALSLDAYQQSVVTILIGYLGAAFQQAVNYWLGTTRQSREKDTVLASLAGTGMQAALRSPPPGENGKMFK
jgi:hypothetical protein